MATKAAKGNEEYVFGQSDIEEMNRRIASGEDIDEVIRNISEKGIALGIHHPIKPGTTKSMNFDTHKTTESKKDLKTIIQAAKDEVGKAPTREKRSALIKRNRELFKKLSREHVSKLTKFEKLVSNPETCKNLQTMDEEELIKLRRESLSLEFDMNDLFGYDSEYVDRAKVIKKKLTDCINMES